MVFNFNHRGTDVEAGNATAAAVNSESGWWKYTKKLLKYFVVLSIVASAIIFIWYLAYGPPQRGKEYKKLPRFPGLVTQTLAYTCDSPGPSFFGKSILWRGIPCSALLDENFINCLTGPVLCYSCYTTEGSVNFTFKIPYEAECMDAPKSSKMCNRGNYLTGSLGVIMILTYCLCYNRTSLYNSSC